MFLYDLCSKVAEDCIILNQQNKYNAGLEKYLFHTQSAKLTLLYWKSENPFVSGGGGYMTRSGNMAIYHTTAL